LISEMKLVPMGNRLRLGQSGLGELLDAKNVYDSNYHSLALDLRPVCAGGAARCVGRALELKMSLSLVTEPIVLHGHGASHDWSFKSSFGGHLFSTCPRASLSKIYIDVTSNKVPNLSEPSPFKHFRYLRCSVFWSLKKA